MVIDSHHDIYDDGHYAYYSAEDLASIQNRSADHVEYSEDDANLSGNDVSLSGTLEHNSLAAPEVPASVRSFSRDSNGYNISSSNKEAFYSVNSDSRLGEQRRQFNPGPSVLSSPSGTPYECGLSLTRSRSALSSPPVYSAMLSPSSPTETVVGSPNGSQSSLVKHKLRNRRTKSTALLDRSQIQKPWLEKQEFRQRLSYWLSWSMIFICAGVSAVIGFLSTRNVQSMGKLCMVLEDNFDNGLDRSVWTHEVDLGGFG